MPQFGLEISVWGRGGGAGAPGPSPGSATDIVSAFEKREMDGGN